MMFLSIRKSVFCPPPPSINLYKADTCLSGQRKCFENIFSNKSSAKENFLELKIFE